MSRMLECLKEYGADIDGIMGRFLGDEDLYKTCFAAFLEDEAFVKLGETIETQKYDKAFECAHTLKGITGNMGLTPLYRIICSIVENLRASDYSDLQEYYVKLISELKKLQKFQ